MDMLPLEFESLAGKVSYVRKISENEWHSSCPQCGGEPHKDGSWPDRFIMWRASKFTGRPFAMCYRHCGYKWSPSKEDANWTPEERDEFRRKMRETEQAWNQHENERLQKLAKRVRSQLAWQRCNEERLQKEDVIRWYEEEHGIPRDWQDYLEVGVLENYSVRGRLSTYRSRAFTIPLWTLGDQIENITLRIANPLDANDRYRRMYKSNAQHLFYPQYTEKPRNKIVLMEGEFKGICGTIRGGLDENQYSVMAVQSKTIEKRVLQKLDFAEVIFLAFDPDAYEPEKNSKRVAVMETAKIIGMERCRFVIPPCNVKFDDAILRGYKFRNAVNMAVKPVQLRS